MPAPDDNNSQPFANDVQAWEARHQAKLGLNHYAIHQISSTAKYFISVCKVDVHSYVLVGCDDSLHPNNPNTYIFSAVGKNFLLKNAAGGDGCRFLFSSINRAALVDESLIKEKWKRRSQAATTISYRAYELSFQQYCNYTQLLQKIPSEERLIYYYPIQARDAAGIAQGVDEEVKGSPNPVHRIYRYALASPDIQKMNLEVTYQEEKDRQEQKSDNDFSSYNKLSVRNTCRHTAIDILRRLKIEDKSLPRFFGFKLPNKMIFQGGKIVGPLFIVPIPPELSLKRDNPILYPILVDLHQNIVRLSQTNYGIDVARMKMNALSELYKQLYKTKKDCDGRHVLTVLSAWERQQITENAPNNTALITQSRGFFSRTKSGAMLERIEKAARKSIR